MGKTKKEIVAIKDRLLKVNGELEQGDFVMGDRGELFKIGKLSVDRSYKEEYQERVELLHTGSDGWSHYGDCELREFENNKYVKVDIEKEEDYEQFEKKALQEAIQFEEKEEENVEESSERALAVLNKDFLVRQKKDVETIQRKFEVLGRILESKRQDLQEYVREMSGKIEKMNKVIGQIELYLGINEDIIQIQKGANADVKTSIYLRQQILYMDEETGVLLESGGLDYKSIDEFDSWATDNKNYKKLIPEEKGVVVLRVRRNDKDYGTGKNIVEMFMNQANHHTYILIRNGDNLYRIWVGIIIQPRLFPTQEEMDIMFEKKERDFFTDKEEMIFSYRQNLLMLQGLIDRTQVFQPLPLKINLFKPKSYGDYVKFIRDDEPSLTEGRKTFREWKKELNSKIKRGTRIYFCGFRWNDTKSYNERDSFSYCFRQNTFSNFFY